MTGWRERGWTVNGHARRQSKLTACFEQRLRLADRSITHKVAATPAIMLILFVAMFPIRLGLSLWLRPALGADALWWSFPAGSLATLVGAALYYRYGPWRRGALRVPQPDEAVPVGSTT